MVNHFLRDHDVPNSVVFFQTANLSAYVQDEVPLRTREEASSRLEPKKKKNKQLPAPPMDSPDKNQGTALRASTRRRLERNTMNIDGRSNKTATQAE